ncbi:Conserved hypothetical protein, DUF2922 [Clostridium neonatale]|uniref:DUF2922 domain-containing protein n=1 Tax=Clostridium neonatale TaxID=137838 RepID=UPI00291C2545|nr:DUF2922 domain-containing protein [Clostridium neonatale]CAI3671973.1 Conserved hypothetical protein, DUF2922 [Clostridium neonatale]
MEYILSMTFNTEGGKTTSLSISGVKNDITEAQVLSLMDLIIEKNIFEVNSVALVSKNSAKLTQRVVTKYEVA